MEEENKVDIGINNGGWEKQESKFDDMWDPEAEGASRELTGKIIEVRSDVGANNSTVYTFEKENGERISTWGSTVLDGKLKTVELGTFCKIQFLGRIPNKSGKGKPYKNFGVFTKK